MTDNSYFFCVCFLIAVIMILAFMAYGAMDRLTNDDIDKVFLKDWGIEDDD